MNTTQLIRRTRDLIDAGESVGSGPFDDTQILRAVNDALSWIYAQQIALQPLSMVQVSTLSGLGISTVSTIAQNLSRVTLPEYVGRIVRIENSDFCELDFTADLADFGGRSGATSREDIYTNEDIPFQAVVGNGNDLIFRGSSSVSSGLRIWYVHRPPELARFVATGGSTTTIDVSVTSATTLGEMKWRPSYYVGGYVEVTSANNAVPVGDIRRISAYARNSAHPDATITVDEAFSASVGSGDVIDMIPQLDSLFHELPCFRAASRLAITLGDHSLKSLLQEEAKELFDRWIALNSTRQSSQPARAYRTK